LSLFDYLTGKLETEEVDLILLNEAPARIVYIIIKDGRPLLCRDEKELIELLDDTVRMYLDFKFFLDDFDCTSLHMIGYKRSKRVV